MNHLFNGHWTYVGGLGTLGAVSGEFRVSMCVCVDSMCFSSVSGVSKCGLVEQLETRCQLDIGEEPCITTLCVPS
jgi:hypothetical protein